MANVLIVYYSRKGQNYWNGSIKNITKGNTERVAEFIQEAVGGELFEIDTVNPYDEDYYVCIEEAKKELHEGTMLMAMFTFLEHYDLSGKRIIPFCTNEGSGMDSSESDLKKICTGAMVEKGLSIHGAEAESSGGKVSSWAKELLKK